MPCGGIFPTDNIGERESRLIVEGGPCWKCGKDPSVQSHYCMEWDCVLCRDCVLPFLETDEGKIVLAHGHEIIIQERA